MAPKLRELKKKNAKPESQAARVEEHYNELEGRIAEVYFEVHKLKFNKDRGKNVTDSQEYSVLKKYDQALQLWNHTLTLEDQWNVRVGDRLPFPQMEHFDDYERSIDFCADFVQKSVEDNFVRTGKRMFGGVNLTVNSATSGQTDPKRVGSVFRRKGSVVTEEGNLEGGDNRNSATVDEENPLSGEEEDEEDERENPRSPSDPNETPIAPNRDNDNSNNGNKNNGNRVNDNDPSDDPDDSDDDSDDDGSGNGNNKGRRNIGKGSPKKARPKNPPPQPPNRANPTNFNRHLFKDLPSFSGDYLDFTEFFDLFKQAVDDTNLSNQFKLNYLKMRLDKDSLALIKNYTGREYHKALQVLLDKYTSLTGVITHINQQAKHLPTPRHPNDIETMTAIVERLRSIKCLFEVYKLDKGFEIEIFKEFYSKMPKFMSDLFFRHLGNTVPTLSNYLKYLEKSLEQLRMKQMYETKGSYTHQYVRPPFKKRFDPVKRYKNTNTYRKFVGSLVEAKKDYEKYKNQKNNKTINQVQQKWTPPVPQNRFNKSGQNFEKRDARLSFPCIKCKHPGHSYLYCNTVKPEDKLKVLNEIKLCHVCFKRGHYSHDCRSTYRCAKCNGKHSSFVCVRPANRFTKRPPLQAGNVACVQVDSEPEDYAVDLSELYNNKTEHVFSVAFAAFQKMNIPIDFDIGANRLTGMLDTGASVNLMPTSLAKDLMLKCYNQLSCLGTPQGQFSTKYATTVKVKIGCYEREVEFLLYDDKHTIILGIKILENFKLAINYDRTVTQYDDRFKRVNKLNCIYQGIVMGVEMDYDLPIEVAKLIEKNKSVFFEHSNKIGKINSEKCYLRLTSEIPITLRPYRCSEEDQENIDNQIKDLLEKKLINESTSPYAFPVVLVDKKDDGKKTRLCINYIKLNEVTQSEHFPMPKIEDMKDLFLNACWFTTIDIASGFHHIEVAEEDKFKTAFSTMNGHFEWNRMPFGLKNAPIIFQRIISNLLQKHKFNKFAINYIDDIIVFSKSFEEHLEHLQQIFKMVAEENISLKLKKCQFAKKSVVYLGYSISENKVEPLRSNTEAIEKVSPPTDLKSLRGFLGKVNYYQKFIPNRAVILHPLYQLLKKNVAWDWNEEAQSAFEKVKQILTSYPVLRLYNPNFKTFLYTDASRKGLGAVLKQSDPNDETGAQFVIGYFSQSLSSYQQNYSVTELELLAIINSIEYWHYYLIGKTFTVITDHLPLKSVNKIGKPNTRLFNWAIRLRQYDFKVEYRSGDKNQEADYLSRHPIEQLREITTGIVCWVDQETVIKVQQEVEASAIPKKVFTEERPEGKRLIFRNADQEKDYLPDGFVKEILLDLHLEKGHLGYKQLELQFIRRYYNPHLNNIIKSVIKECEICQQVKHTIQKYGTLGQIGPAQEPFEIIHIDTKSGFKGYGSTKDNLHLAIDAFTRFVWAVSSKTKMGIDFINLINKIMTVQKPKLIVSDNYPAIKGKQFQDFLKKNEIAMVFVAVNHPSSNGLVERVNQTIVQKLKCKRIENPKIAWTTHVNECITEYNNSIHSSTKFTPAYLLTGADDEKLFSNIDLTDARIQAFENSMSRHERDAKVFNKSRKDPDIQIGESVYVETKHQLNRGMLEPSFQGPYPVIDKIGNTTYVVDKGDKTERYHVSQMKMRRWPKYIDRFALLNTVFTILCLLATGITLSSANQTSIQKTGPILWRKTNHITSTGYNYTTHVAILMNPCQPLLKMADESNDTQLVGNYLTCNSEYEKIIKLIKNHCDPVSEVNVLGMRDTHIHRRHKRSTGRKRIKRFAILAGALIGGLVSYGIMTIQHYFRDKETTTVYDDMNDKIRDEITLIKTNNNLTTKFQNTILESLNKTWVRLHDLHALTAALSKSARILMLVLNTIKEMQQHLEVFFEKQTMGKVSSSYNYLFPESPLLRLSPIPYWNSHKCEFQSPDTLIMKFEVPRLSKEIKVLQADAFYILDKEGKKGEECMMSYGGLEFMLWNTKTNCMRDYLGKPLHENSVLLVHEEPYKCVQLTNRTKNWKTDYCEERVKQHQFVQMKKDEQFMYVYCYTHELKLEGEDPIECENVVYKFGNKKTFYIDMKEYEMTSTRYLDRVDMISSRVNDLINERSFVPKSEFAKDYIDLSKIIKQEKFINSLIEWKDLKKPEVYGSFSGGFTLLLLAIIGCCFWKQKAIKRKNSMYRNVIEKTLEMKERKTKT